MDFKELERNLKALDIEALTIEAAMRKSPEMVDLNTGQLRIGKLSTGEDTQEYASIYYTNKKAKMGSLSVPNMDFLFTGKFYAGWYVKQIRKKAIEFGSKDKKAKFLEANWSSDIYGLTEDSTGKLVDMMLDDGYLQDEILNKLTK